MYLLEIHYLSTLNLCNMRTNIRGLPLGLVMPLMLSLRSTG